jgi:hypothetical protein
VAAKRMLDKANFALTLARVNFTPRRNHPRRQIGQAIHEARQELDPEHGSGALWTVCPDCEDIR